ncbi:MAG: serine/threonine protein kinase, partial [Myxococcales bacterium]|nr:serine/threonine protein kinase [Myxococcales bacterium]
MALVWLARFGGKLAGFEKLVVVKTILPQYAQDPRFQRMFLDEARIAARIEHPNVARILDVGEERGTYYIVMEWVDGDSLSKLMRACDEARQPMPLGAALQIAADVCLGLEAAHTLCDAAGEPLGVVHRDVSPQNVLIGPAGEAKLIDFGVAKARDRMAQDTTAGQLKGKLRYMSPEQAKGGNLDGRADVWSVGALLYEMLTGEPPFDGPHELAILHRLVSGESPRPLPGTIPPFVRSIVERSMRYEAHERFESARAMGAALEAALMKLGEGAAHQSVASVAEAMLAGRTMQRRRTVEAALLAAQKRSQMSTRNNTNDGVVHEAYPAFAEVAPEPSHASNATLGSAALAGPPSLDSEDSERRKILGMIVVAA